MSSAVLVAGVMRSTRQAWEGTPMMCSPERAPPCHFHLREVRRVPPVATNTLLPPPILSYSTTPTLLLLLYYSYFTTLLLPLLFLCIIIIRKPTPNAER